MSEVNYFLLAGYQFLILAKLHEKSESHVKWVWFASGVIHIVIAGIISFSKPCFVRFAFFVPVITRTSYGSSRRYRYWTLVLLFAGPRRYCAIFEQN